MRGRFLVQRYPAQGSLKSILVPALLLPVLLALLDRDCLMVVPVMLVIQDFDRPITGFIVVSHDSTHSLIAEMEADLDNQ